MKKVIGKSEMAQSKIGMKTEPELINTVSQVLPHMAGFKSEVQQQSKTEEKQPLSHTAL